MKGSLVLETGEVYTGSWGGGPEQAGEVVFNTSHSGYEEIATDPSYFKQIMVMTAPMQGNYGVSESAWESDQAWIRGFVCLEAQGSPRDSSWRRRLEEWRIPLLTDIDTRSLVLKLREKGTVWGALVRTDDKSEALRRGRELIAQACSGPTDWVFETSAKKAYDRPGQVPSGPRVAVLDLGSKRNILRELEKRCSAVRVFPSRTSPEEILAFAPQGLVLTNGPGDPADVQVAVATVKSLLGEIWIFGICMGHQILSLALGMRTYRLKFGHRGSNHPIQDDLLGRIYVSSQNHGYAVERESLPKTAQVTHTNLNDNSVAGVMAEGLRCFGVQFHPESHPGPHDAEGLFDYFVGRLR